MSKKSFMGGIEIMKKLLIFLLCVLLVVIVFVIVFNFIIIFNYHHSQSLRKRLPAREYIAHGWLVIEMVSFHLRDCRAIAEHRVSYWLWRPSRENPTRQT